MRFSFRLALEVKFRAFGITFGSLRQSGILSVPSFRFDADEEYIRPIGNPIIDQRGVLVIAGVI